MGGNQFTGEPVHFSYIPDQVLEQAREVTIKLHARAGRFLKLQLYFAARWIMLSEVIFESGKRKKRLFVLLPPAPSLTRFSSMGIYSPKRYLAQNTRRRREAEERIPPSLVPFAFASP